MRLFDRRPPANPIVYGRGSAAAKPQHQKDSTGEVYILKFRTEIPDGYTANDLPWVDVFYTLSLNNRVIDEGHMTHYIDQELQPRLEAVKAQMIENYRKKEADKAAWPYTNGVEYTL